MPESSICLSSRALLYEISEMRQKFIKLYGEVGLDSPRSAYVELKTLQDAIKKKIDVHSREIWSVEAEQLLHLRKQYDEQVKLLVEAYIVKKVPIGETPNIPQRYYIKGIDGREYDLPSFEEVSRIAYEKRDVLRIKVDQGFTKFLLVPFAMSLEELAGRFEGHLARHRDKHQGFALAVRPIALSLTSGKSEPLRDDDFVYGEERLKKIDILHAANGESALHNGWQMLFLQTYDQGKRIQPIEGRRLPTVYRDSVGTKIPRYPIGSGKSPHEYAAPLEVGRRSSDSAYQGESGMTLESWMIACIYHLQTTGNMLDSVYFSQGKGNICVDSRAANAESSSTYSVEWSSHDDGRQVEIRQQSMTEADPRAGLRTEVRM